MSKELHILMTICEKSVKIHKGIVNPVLCLLYDKWWHFIRLFPDTYEKYRCNYFQTFKNHDESNDAFV